MVQACVARDAVLGSSRIATMLFSSATSRSAPSPEMTIEKRSARSTVTLFHTSMAKPNESKPGPRLAVVAGTLITTRSTCAGRAGVSGRAESWRKGRQVALPQPLTLTLTLTLTLALTLTLRTGWKNDSWMRWMREVA